MKRIYNPNVMEFNDLSWLPAADRAYSVNNGEVMVSAINSNTSVVARIPFESGVVPLHPIVIEFDARYVGTVPRLAIDWYDEEAFGGSVTTLSSLRIESLEYERLKFTFTPPVNCKSYKIAVGWYGSGAPHNGELYMRNITIDSVNKYPDVDDLVLMHDASYSASRLDLLNKGLNGTATITLNDDILEFRSSGVKNERCYVDFPITPIRDFDFVLIEIEARRVNGDPQIYVESQYLDGLQFLDSKAIASTDFERYRFLIPNIALLSVQDADPSDRKHTQNVRALIGVSTDYDGSMDVKSARFAVFGGQNDT